MNWLTYHKNLLQLAEVGKTLTPSQSLARDAILNALKVWKTHINLWGAAGVGKTFLGHSLHHCADLVYFVNRTRYDPQPPRGSVVVIDNAPHGRQEARNLYDEIRWGKKDYTGPVNVILITREPIDDAVHRIELTLTDADITHIENLMRQQFGECDFKPVSQYAQQRSGLWRYIKAIAQREE